MDFAAATRQVNAVSNTAVKHKGFRTDEERRAFFAKQAAPAKRGTRPRAYSAAKQQRRQTATRPASRGAVCRTPRNVILRGDSMRGLRRLCPDSVDLILTDPPYGINWHGNNGSQIQGDDAVRAEWLQDAYRVLRSGGALYLFTRWDVYPEWRAAVENAGFLVKQLLVWRKNTGGQGDLTGTYAPDGEFIIFASKGRHTFRRKRRLNQVLLHDNPVASIKRHPHQKPTLLLGDLIQQSSRRRELVLDPFAGSGSTAVACVQQGRDYLAWEQDRQHHAEAKRRIHHEGPLAPGSDLHPAAASVPKKQGEQK